MPRLSSSPQRPQLPRLPHLPGTVQGAGSLANLSSSGYCGACWALAAAIDRNNTPAAVPTKPRRRDVRRFMAFPPYFQPPALRFPADLSILPGFLLARRQIRDFAGTDEPGPSERSCSGDGGMVKDHWLTY